MMTSVVVVYVTCTQPYIVLGTVCSFLQNNNLPSPTHGKNEVWMCHQHDCRSTAEEAPTYLPYSSLKAEREYLDFFLHFPFPVTKIYGVEDFYCQQGGNTIFVLALSKLVHAYNFLHIVKRKRMQQHFIFSCHSSQILSCRSRKKQKEAKLETKITREGMLFLFPAANNNDDIKSYSTLLCLWRHNIMIMMSGKTWSDESRQIS